MPNTVPKKKTKFWRTGGAGDAADTSASSASGSNTSLPRRTPSGKGNNSFAFLPKPPGSQKPKKRWLFRSEKQSGSGGHSAASNTLDDDDSDDVSTPTKRVTRASARLAKQRGDQQAQQAQQPAQQQGNIQQQDQQQQSPKQPDRKKTSPANSKNAFDAQTLLSSLPEMFARYGYDGPEHASKPKVKKPVNYLEKFMNCTGPDVTVSDLKKLDSADLQLLIEEAEEQFSAAVEHNNVMLTTATALHLEVAISRAELLSEEIPHCEDIGLDEVDNVMCDLPLRSVQDIQLFFFDFRNVIRLTKRFFAQAESNGLTQDQLNRIFMKQTFTLELQRSLCWERLDTTRNRASMTNTKPRLLENCILIPSVCQDWYRRTFALVFGQAAADDNEEPLRLMFQNRRRRVREGDM